MSGPSTKWYISSWMYWARSCSLRTLCRLLWCQNAKQMHSPPSDVQHPSGAISLDMLGSEIPYKQQKKMRPQPRPAAVSPDIQRESAGVNSGWKAKKQVLLQAVSKPFLAMSVLPLKICLSDVFDRAQITQTRSKCRASVSRLPAKLGSTCKGKLRVDGLRPPGTCITGRISLECHIAVGVHILTALPLAFNEGKTSGLGTGQAPDLVWEVVDCCWQCYLRKALQNKCVPLLRFEVVTGGLVLTRSVEFLVNSVRSSLSKSTSDSRGSNFPPSAASSLPSLPSSMLVTVAIPSTGISASSSASTLTPPKWGERSPSRFSSIWVLSSTGSIMSW